jgi:hypothetical protein
MRMKAPRGKGRASEFGLVQDANDVHPTDDGKWNNAFTFREVPQVMHSALHLC